MKGVETNFCGKVISIRYFECVFLAPVIQYSILMRRILLSSVAFLAIRYFAT